MSKAIGAMIANLTGSAKIKKPAFYAGSLIHLILGFSVFQA